MRYVLLLMLLASVACAAPVQFVDEWSALGMPLYGQQSAALVKAKPEALKGNLPVKADQAQYAIFSLTSERGAPAAVAVSLIDVAVALTEQGGQRTLFVDANGDGLLDANEAATPAAADQRPPGFGEAAQPVWVANIEKPFARTVAFRLNASTGMLVMAVRGYATTEIATGKGPVRLYVEDTNANLVLDDKADALYVDLNGDGKLDGPGERIAAGQAVDVADMLVEPTLGAPFNALNIAFEKTVDVPARFTIAALKTPPVKLSASLLRRGGGATTVTSLGQPMDLRAGSYSIMSLSMGLHNAGGAMVYYNFEQRGGGAPWLAHPAGPTTLELIGKVTIKPTWSLTEANGEPATAAHPGSELACDMDAVTATGMGLVGCNTQDPTEGYPTKTPPVVELVDPAGKVVFSGAMTFG